jgi:non-ribosomal peptide synthetase component F
VALVLQNVPRSSLDLQGLSLSQYQLKYETAKFELSLVLGEGEGGITGALMYLTDLFDASTAARMVKNFQTLLRDITENPDKKIEDLSMFDDEGSRELIRAFNDELE